MTINFTDSPANGATQVVGGRTYTYNSAKNKWDTTATEVTGPTATVYANVDALPTSGNITGAQAYVSGNNRLYIWNGTGWYNIALINTAPSIGGANSSYALAIDGTPTTVTLTASDPEGLPVAYSIASDTSGNIATVTQGTGVNVNVFTITPTTNTANAGTFSLTFRASDGVNLATAVSEFSLVFQITNSNYTTALITTNGSTGINTTFTDSSTNSHTITANGDANQSSFSPYRHGGYSTYFDGSGDYIELPNAAGNSASDTFTVEFWVQDPEVVSGSAPFYTQGSGSSNNAFAIDWTGTAIRVDYYGNNITHTVDLADGAWHHIAVTLDGYSRARKLWLDGSLVASDSNTSGAFSATNCVIGRMPWASRVYKGYMRDFRISDNIRYSATFTPPEEPLVSDSNTKLLACHLPYFADGSTNNHTLTLVGNVSTKPFSPYDYSPYTVGNHGGSVYFDGTGDYLRVANSANFDFPSDFTLEFWANFDNTSWPSYLDITGNANNGAYIGSGRGGWIASYYDSNSTLKFSYQYNSSWVFEHSFVLSAGLEPDQWYHIAFTRESNSLKCFLNGQQVGSTITESTSIVSGEPLDIGTGYNGTGTKVNGSISDYRIVQGTAVYTANFTPPTAPLTAITNTSLLLGMQGAVILDKSQSANNLKLIGNTTASTAQYKYLPSSMYFDGSGDYISVPQIELGTGDFTIEGWHYLLTRANTRNGIWGNYSSYGSGALGMFAGHSSGTTTAYQVAYNGSAFPGGGLQGGTIVYNQWVHFAVVRNSGTMTLYINGSSVDSMTATASLNGSGSNFIIGSPSDNTGSSIDGYLEDFRVTKGLARYTANFTPPSAALEG